MLILKFLWRDTTCPCQTARGSFLCLCLPCLPYAFDVFLTLDYDRALAVVYSVLTPFLNPFIYSLRNKEIKKAVRRQLKRMGILE